MEQLPLDFGPAFTHLKHPTVVLRWQNDGVVAEWTEQHLLCWFPEWRIALENVFHELNEHINVRVRT